MVLQQSLGCLHTVRQSLFVRGLLYLQQIPLCSQLNEADEANTGLGHALNGANQPSQADTFALLHNVRLNSARITRAASLCMLDLCNTSCATCMQYPTALTCAVPAPRGA